MSNLNSNGGVQDILSQTADLKTLDDFFQKAHLTAFKTAKIESIYHKGVHYIKELFKKTFMTTNSNIHSDERWWVVFEEFMENPPDSFKLFKLSIPERTLEVISDYQIGELEKSYSALNTDVSDWIKKKGGALSKVDVENAEEQFKLTLVAINEEIKKIEQELPDPTNTRNLFLSDIQANILKRIKNDHTFFCFLRFPALVNQKKSLDEEFAFFETHAKVKLASSMKTNIESYGRILKNRVKPRGIKEDENIQDNLDTTRIKEKIEAFLDKQKIKLEKSAEFRNNKETSRSPVEPDKFNNEKNEYQQKREEFYLKRKEVVEWLKAMPITSAKQQIVENKKTVISIAFSFEGLQLLFDAKRFNDLFPKEDDDHTAFAEGIRKRCSSAFGYQNIENIDPPYKIPAHALLIVSLAEREVNEESKNERLKELLEKKKDYIEFFKAIGHPAGFPFKEEEFQLFYEMGHFRKENGTPKEWFGFRDGISNPRFFSDKTKFKELKDIAKVPVKFEPSSKLGTVLRPDALSPTPYGCGSFIAFLKLQQNKQAFEEKVKRLSDKLGVDKEKAEAYIIGRYKDGSPLHPLNNKDQFGEGNKFDKEGQHCPFHAHIRKANPREDDNWREKRIVRRGKLYGKENSDDKGMLFFSYQSSLLHFENIINTSIYSYNRKGAYIGKDPLFMKSGDHNRGVKYMDNNDNMTTIYGEEINPLVEFKGGQYFYAPSISFIKYNLENCL